MVYGYCRISMAKQSMERQIRNIKDAYPQAVILREVSARTDLDRREWNKLFRHVTAGDTIVFDSVSRMGGTAEEGFRAYEALYRRGVSLVFLKEPHINTDTYRQALGQAVPLTGNSVDCILDGVNRFLLSLAREQIRLAFLQSEKEVEDLRQRTKEGIETARLNGHQIGQRPGAKLVTQKSIAAKKIIRKHAKTFGGSLTDAEVIRLAGLSRNTYYKYKAELRNEANPLDPQQD